MLYFPDMQKPSPCPFHPLSQRQRLRHDSSNRAGGDHSLDRFLSCQSPLHPCLCDCPRFRSSRRSPTDDERTAPACGGGPQNRQCCPRQCLQPCRGSGRRHPCRAPFQENGSDSSSRSGQSRISPRKISSQKGVDPFLSSSHRTRSKTLPRPKA